VFPQNGYGGYSSLRGAVVSSGGGEVREGWPKGKLGPLLISAQ